LVTRLGILTGEDGSMDCYTEVAERGEKVKEKVSDDGSDVLHAWSWSLE
jgi:hypothetical protein